MLNLIHTLKHGNQTWFPFKEVMFCRSPVLVAGIFGVGMGVAGLMMGWKNEITGFPRALLWRSSKRRDSSENLCSVAGLKNLGNNCFLNVILQALASCCCFHPSLQSVIEANDLVAMGEVEDLPLTVALAALLRELCIVRDERLVVSPQRVMSALGIYVSSFNLTRQQDAAEALAHLLSSLKEEVSEHYIPCYGSLADISSPGGRVSHPKKESETEWGRWRQHLFGPFDGTLGSILSCKSCSFQLSMDFELFHCLPLSPVMDGSGSIIHGCTVEDCLKQFTASEHIENYRCNQCVHVAAARYLSLNVEANETKIKNLQNCIKHDSCDCKNLLLSEGIPWPTGYSCAYKQLSIGRCPKIFCIHLQRASVSDTGEMIKLPGHISFPLVLDFFPFTAASIGVGMEFRENTCMQVKQQQLFSSHLSNFQMQMLQHVYGPARKHILSEDNLGSPVHISSQDSIIQAIKGESYCINGELGSKAQIPDLALDQPWFKSGCTDKLPQYYDEMQFNEGPHSIPLKNYIYRLVSVVEHYGRVGSGHYAVYRRAKALTDADDSGGQTNAADVHWFYASDAEVLSVSEEDVLAAEASVLFYERIEVTT